MNELTKVSMKNYLSSPAISKYVEEILQDRKGTFIATVTSLVNGNDKLQDCDKQTILMAALKAVGLNLPIEPSLGFAYIIPYGDKAQFQLGVKGLTQLALRSGEYAGINAMEVREGEFFGRDDLGDPIIHWLPEDERLNKKVIGFMSAFKTNKGFSKKVYWTIKQVEEHANRFSQGYQAYKKYGASTSRARSGNLTNPWESDFNSMASKTVLKNLLSKYGVLSIEVQDAIKADQAIISVTDDGSEILEYADNPNNTKSVADDLIPAKEQKAILKEYGSKVVKGALNEFQYSDISDIPKDAVSDFRAYCEAHKGIAEE